jgi:iron complex outermembrane receptor protein
MTSLCPQGTLFGKNTTGGAVTVRTKRPVLGSFGIDMKLQLGDFGTRIIQGAVNIPIIRDKVALRVVGGYQEDHGYYRNGGCYGPVTGFFPGNKWQGVSGCLNGDHVGGKKVWNGRVKLLAEPSDKLSILLQYEKLHDRSQPVPSVNENFRFQNPAFPFVTDQLGLGRRADSGDPLDNAMITTRDDALLEMSKGQRIDVDGIYLNMNYDTGFGRLTSVTGWRTQKSRLPNSYSGVTAIAPDGEQLSVFDARRDDDRKTFQQELRFATKTGTAFDAVVGGFYQKDQISFCADTIIGFLDLVIGPLPFGAWNDTPYMLCNAQKAESKAVFAEGTFKATDKLTFTGGVRYTWENKTWWGRQHAFIPMLNGGFDPTISINQPLDANIFDYTAGVVEVKDSVKKPTWRISAGYQATPDIFTYATYSRGFKAGGFNDSVGTFSPFGSDLAAFREAAKATKPETADSFEVGLKSEFFNRRVRFNLTGFYVKYKDLQRELNVPIIVNGIQNQVTRFVNAASATVKGIELETVARVTPQLTLLGVMGYQDGKYSSYVVEPGLGGTPGSGYDLATTPLLRTPKWTWSVNGTYNRPITSNLKLVLNANVSHVSSNLFSQSITARDGNAYLNSRTLLNGSITLAQVDDEYYVRAVGRNLTDERYRTANQNVGSLWLNSQYGPPRYFGAELGFKFRSR